MKADRSVAVVVGGTGNIGSRVVGALLDVGARVVVPSRSERKLGDLKTFLSSDASDGRDLSLLATYVGDIGADGEGIRLAERIVEEVGYPTGVVASLGQFVPAPSLIRAEPDDLRSALESYVVAHFAVARAFIPLLQPEAGTYVFINGFLAFTPRADWGAGLVSIATSAQHMLFRSLSQELEDLDVDLAELVVHTLVSDRQSQPGSPVSAAAIGAYAAALATKQRRLPHGASHHLDSVDALTAGAVGRVEAPVGGGA